MLTLLLPLFFLSCYLHHLTFILIAAFPPSELKCSSANNNISVVVNKVSLCSEESTTLSHPSGTKRTFSLEGFRVSVRWTMFGVLLNVSFSGRMVTSIFDPQFNPDSWFLYKFTFSLSAKTGSEKRGILLFLGQVLWEKKVSLLILCVPKCFIFILEWIHWDQYWF